MKSKTKHHIELNTNDFNQIEKAVLSKWFSPEFAEGYINDILFDIPPIPK